MPSRFVAPKRVETLEDVRKALQMVQEQFDANGISRARQQLVTQSTTLRAGEFVRLSPRQGQTLYAKLPKATAENIGLRIEISIEQPNGIVKIAAEKPDTVSGLATASFTLAGLIILESNGNDQWVLFNQLPTNSPGAATNYFFSNANNVSFGTVGSTVTASVTVASTQGSIRVSAGTTNALSSLFSFSNGSNINWGINTNGVITGSWLGLSVSAGTTSGQVTNLRFQNSNNVTFGFNTNGTITASVASSLDRVAAGTLAFLGAARGISFQDLGNVAFNASTNAGSPDTVFIQATAGIGISGGTTNTTATGISFSHDTGTIRIAFNTALTGNVEFFQTGNTISGRAAIRMSGGTTAFNGTLFSFANGGGVSFGISTNFASVPVITASVNAGGGVAVADIYGNTVSNGTVVFSLGASSTFSNLWSNNTAQSNNVAFGFNGSTITAQAHMRASDGTGGNGNVFTRINFVATNGITFNVDTAQGTAGTAAGTGDRMVNVSASYQPLFISGVVEGGAGAISATSVVIIQRTITAGVFDAQSLLPVNALFTGSTLQLHYDPPRIQGFGQWNRVTGGASLPLSSIHSRPFFFQPFFGEPLVFPGRGTNMAMGDWNIGHANTMTASSQWTTGAGLTVTYFLGLYSVQNGTGSVLSLVNSQSFTVARSSGGATNQIYGGFAGNRFLNFSQGAWASNSGLSHGEWLCAIMCHASSSNETRVGILGQAAGMPHNFQNVGQNGSQQQRNNAFCGLHTATTHTGLPQSVISAHISGSGTAATANIGTFVPMVSIHALNNAAFG